MYGGAADGTDLNHGLKGAWHATSRFGIQMDKMLGWEQFLGSIVFSPPVNYEQWGWWWQSGWQIDDKWLLDDDEDEIDRKGENWLLDDQKDEDGDKDANDGDNWLVDNKRPVLQARPSRSFHLPELLQLLHHVHCKCFRFTIKLQLYRLKLISVQTCFYVCFKTFICKRFLLAWRNMLTTQKIVHNQLPAGVLSIIANCPLLCFSLSIISCWDSISSGAQTTWLF